MLDLPIAPCTDRPKEQAGCSVRAVGSARSGYGEWEAPGLIQLNEAWSNLSRSAGGRAVLGKAREEANEIALASGPGFGEDACEMGAHRRDAASPLHRRVANA